MALLVTGAAEGVGRLVAERLAAPEVDLRLVGQDPALLPQLAGSRLYGTDARALEEACQAVEVAVLLPLLAWPRDDEADAALRAALAAAEGLHLVVVSLQGAAADARHPLARAHHEREEAWRTLPAALTILRPSLPMALVPKLFDPDGALRGPGGDGAVAFVAHADVAATAAAVAMAPAPDERRTLEVTGPEALTLAALATRVGRLTGLDLRYLPEPEERTRSRFLEAGAGEAEVDVLVGTYLAIADGAFAPLRDTVQRLTRAAPLGLERYLEAHRDALSRLRPDSAG
jgi:NAD(P)H dehydrogenase (quinone)